MSKKICNTNFIGEDGLVYNIYIGDQTSSTLKKTYEQLNSITTELRKKKKKVLILTDITNIGSINMQARRYGIEMIRSIDYDKVAVYGNSIFTEQIANFIITASGMGFKIKCFLEEEKARNWLLVKG